IACIRENELESGNYRLKVNGEEYPAEIYNYEENINYITDKNLGTTEADSRMLIMKYKGNVTVNEERIVTAETRKKGMFICVEGQLTNSGEISMAGRGANAEGQDVYLWRHENGVYEYVPAEGENGGIGVYANRSGAASVHVIGNNGNNGNFRETGGGGSGEAWSRFSVGVLSGNGANGTSYSGGTGGGSAQGTRSTSNSPASSINGLPGEPNGGAGGNGLAGGTGNPGGTPNGKNGTGGLLILYSNKLENNNKINSNGIDSNQSGGASGGGSVNIFYNKLISKGIVEAIGGNGGSGGAGGNGYVVLQDINMKSPSIDIDEVTMSSFKVKIIDSNFPREKVEYDYYVNNEIKISKSSLLEETIDGLNPETEYRVRIRAYYDGVIELFSNEVIIQTLTPPEVIYVAMDGDDITGDGTELKPYAGIDKAIEVAYSGQKIHISEGTYNLKPMNNDYIDASGNQDKYAQAGITDKNKKLEIYGENEKTILIYDGALSGRIDAPAVSIYNEESILRNVTYIFKPKTGYNYSKAIFRWCNGTINNVFFRISGNNRASYLYHNTQKVPNSVINCTFFHDLGVVDGNYSGISNFTDIATNINTNGTNTNVIIQNFGSTTTSIEELIENSKTNEAFISNQVGVYYGSYAWNK
ncbi:MAG: fibronectin type III domain-containing protein, partial [Clostridia bacterium]|nr:fibronectin type III domain-containing protein [Clostridia bacterium]